MILHQLIKGFLGFLTGLIIFIAFAVVIIWITLPEISFLKTQNPSKTALMIFRQSERLLAGKSLRWVRLKEISPELVRSTVISEDQNFNAHQGLEWRAIFKSMKANFAKGSKAYGGSTITQQLARNLFLSPEKTWFRKIKEALIAWKLERALSKGRILELYLNVVEWGDGVYGIDHAARLYFQKRPIELNLSESIRLVSVIPSPLKNNPLENQNSSLKARQIRIAYNLFNRGMIDPSAFIRVLDELAVPNPPGFFQAFARALILRRVLFL